MLLKQFQNKSGFEIDQRKTCPFSLQIGSSVPTFMDMYLHLLLWKNFFLQLLKFHQQGQPLRINDESFKFRNKLRNLVTIVKRKHKDSYLSQIHISGLIMICSNLI